MSAKTSHPKPKTKDHDDRPRAAGIWTRRLEQMAEFKKKFGHCPISKVPDEYASLVNWVNTQRRFRKMGAVSKEKIAQLDKLGFIWDPVAHVNDGMWNTFFDLLAAFHRKHGHCGVDHRVPEQKRLATWMQSQRNLRKIGKISDERIRRLDSLGFVWGQRDSTWQRMYELLKAYKRKHGHCNMPLDYATGGELGLWLRGQILRWRLKTLSPQRCKQLKALGIETPSPERPKRRRSRAKSKAK